MQISRLAVLMTCFNRRVLTLRALDSLFSQERPEHTSLDVFLVDDGSQDGTGEAIRANFPSVHLLTGNGSLFWNGGMWWAFDTALKEHFDAYVLFNDDVVLYPGALRQVLLLAEGCLARQEPAIIVGSTRESSTGEVTYGGFARREKGPTSSFQLIHPDPVLPLPCDTMNGNFVLIPSLVAQSVGNLEKRFHHMFGDVDYGLRARKAGFNLLIAPGFVGECEKNTTSGTWQDRRVPFRERLKKVSSPKGLPFADWFLFTLRHYGWRFPLYLFSPYLKQVVRSIIPSQDA